MPEGQGPAGLCPGLEIGPRPLSGQSRSTWWTKYLDSTRQTRSASCLQNRASVSRPHRSHTPHAAARRDCDDPVAPEDPRQAMRVAVPALNGRMMAARGAPWSVLLTIPNINPEFTPRARARRQWPSLPTRQYFQRRPPRVSLPSAGRRATTKPARERLTKARTDGSIGSLPGDPPRGILARTVSMSRSKARLETLASAG